MRPQHASEGAVRKGAAAFSIAVAVGFAAVAPGSVVADSSPSTKAADPAGTAIWQVPEVPDDSPAVSESSRNEAGSFVLIVANGESFDQALIRQARQNPGQAEIMLPIVEAAADEPDGIHLGFDQLDQVEVIAAASSLRGELGRTSVDHTAGSASPGWVDADAGLPSAEALGPMEAASPTFEGQQLLQVFVCDNSGCNEVARAILDTIIDLGLNSARLNGKVQRGIGWSGFSAPIVCLRGSTNCGSNTVPTGNFFQYPPKIWNLTSSMNGAKMRVTFSGTYLGTFATVTGDTPAIGCTSSACQFN